MRPLSERARKRFNEKVVAFFATLTPTELYTVFREMRVTYPLAVQNCRRALRTYKRDRAAEIEKLREARRAHAGRTRALDCEVEP